LLVARPAAGVLVALAVIPATPGAMEPLMFFAFPAVSGRTNWRAVREVKGTFPLPPVGREAAISSRTSAPAKHAEHVREIVGPWSVAAGFELAPPSNRP